MQGKRIRKKIKKENEIELFKNPENLKNDLDLYLNITEKTIKTKEQDQVAILIIKKTYEESLAKLKEIKRENDSLQLFDFIIDAVNNIINIHLTFKISKIKNL